MKKFTKDFTLELDGVVGLCPAGEAWAERNITKSLYHKYTDVFDMEDVPEAERIETARQVAGHILSTQSGAVVPAKPVEDESSEGEKAPISA